MVQAHPPEGQEHSYVEIDEQPLDEYTDLPMENDPKGTRCYYYSVSETFSAKPRPKWPALHSFYLRTLLSLMAIGCF